MLATAKDEVLQTLPLAGTQTSLYCTTEAHRESVRSRTVARSNSGGSGGGASNARTRAAGRLRESSRQRASSLRTLGAIVCTRNGAVRRIREHRSIQGEGASRETAASPRLYPGLKQKGTRDLLSECRPLGHTIMPSSAGVPQPYGPGSIFTFQHTPPGSGRAPGINPLEAPKARSRCSRGHGPAQSGRFPARPSSDRSAPRCPRAANRRAAYPDHPRAN